MNIHRRFTASPAPVAQRGMSLIEIIIVIVLIGAVLAFVGSRIVGGKESGDYRLEQAKVQTLAQKIHMYESDTGGLPQQLVDLVVDPGQPGWLGPYVKESALKDQWNNDYIYTVPGESGGFDLVSLGGDGEPGGSSTDADIRYE